jgi:drug/metabolite transporter (DMT)-like permease
MNRQVRADLMLFAVTIFWGASYILTKFALEALEPFNLTALRLLIAFAASGLVFYRRILKSDKRTIQYSLVLSVILVCMFISMSYGLKYTTASNAGFLISLAVIIIPILSYLFLKQKIEKKVIIGVCIAPIGIALLTLNSRFSISGGDLLCIVCALFSAAHVVCMGVFTHKVDSVALGILQLGFAGVFSLIFSFFTETVRLPDTTVAWGATLTLSILCTAVGYLVQATAQQYTSATHTGLILSLEPVFSAVFGYVFLSEVLLPRGYAGAAILLLSVLIAELDFKKKAIETEEDDACAMKAK